MPGRTRYAADIFSPNFTMFSSGKATTNKTYEVSRDLGKAAVQRH
jgi:hypothetical protein